MSQDSKTKPITKGDSTAQLSEFTISKDSQSKINSNREVSLIEKSETCGSKSSIGGERSKVSAPFYKEVPIMSEIRHKQLQSERS